MVAVHIAEPEVRPLKIRGLNTLCQAAPRDRGGRQRVAGAGAVTEGAMAGCVGMAGRLP